MPAHRSSRTYARHPLIPAAHARYPRVRQPRRQRARAESATLARPRPVALHDCRTHCTTVPVRRFLRARLAFENPPAVREHPSSTRARRSRMPMLPPALHSRTALRPHMPVVHACPQNARCPRMPAYRSSRTYAHRPRMPASALERLGARAHRLVAFWLKRCHFGRIGSSKPPKPASFHPFWRQKRPYLRLFSQSGRLADRIDRLSRPHAPSAACTERPPPVAVPAARLFFSRSTKHVHPVPADSV